MKLRVFFLFFLNTIILFGKSSTTHTQSPSTEIRAVWLTTIWNLDWPSPNLNAEGQKKELCKILDQLKQSNFNTVFFQTRLRGNVFYKSSIEPLSPFAKSEFDPLAFAIEECHKRGLECHAWFVTFPVSSKKTTSSKRKKTNSSKLPPNYIEHNDEYYLDPGNPDTRKHILSLVDEIVRGYDIDGIHFDYIRYPDKATKFADKTSHQKYGKGTPIGEWRRHNINLLVSEVYDHIKRIKPWVQVSSSPLGKYKDLNNGRDGWTGYESVYQDACHWLKTGKHDAIYPMMYYQDRHFYPYLEEWIKNSNNRPVVPGLGAYRLLQQEGNWDKQHITEQIDFIREKKVKGQAFFRAGNIINDVKGINSALKENYYRYPAKLPAMIWLDSVAPNSPVDLEVFQNKHGKLHIRWKPFDNDENLIYTVYCSENEDIDINNPENIIATGIRRNEIELDIKYGDFGLYYTITASNRFHNESVISFPAFFTHTEYKK